MLIEKKKLTNIAGLMGGNAAQPAAMLGQATVDPLERLNQKMAGRMQGGAVEGKEKRKKRSMLNSIGMM